MLDDYWADYKAGKYQVYETRAATLPSAAP
jgi:hypothetical protein